MNALKMLYVELLTSFLPPFWTVGSSMFPLSWKKNSLPVDGMLGILGIHIPEKHKTKQL